MCSTTGNISIPTPSPVEPVRLPASAGAGQDRQGSWFTGLDHGTVAPLNLSYALTYSEIGILLCDCVNEGIIDHDQARKIGQIFFPIQE